MYEAMYKKERSKPAHTRPAGNDRIISTSHLIMEKRTDNLGMKKNCRYKNARMFVEETLRLRDRRTNERRGENVSTISSFLAWMDDEMNS
jgi:hypothetical protein